MGASFGLSTDPMTDETPITTTTVNAEPAGAAEDRAEAPAEEPPKKKRRAPRKALGGVAKKKRKSRVLAKHSTEKLEARRTDLDQRLQKYSKVTARAQRALDDVVAELAERTTEGAGGEAA
jgi:hypothetical protein